MFSWMSKRLHWPLLPALEEFRWAKRRVILCFDSDVAGNHMVQIALSRLAVALTQRGAVVHNITLPPRADGGKQGMDDFMYTTGVAEFEALVANAPGVSASVELHRLNTEVALVRQTAEVVRLEDGHVFPARKFTDSLYKNRVYTQFTVAPDGSPGRPVTKFAAKEWLEWPMRAELRRLTYMPGKERITADGDYNSWRGWATEPRRGDTRPWENLLRLVFEAATEADIVWFKRWLAYPLRYPGTKLYTAVLVWSRTQGTGKSLLGETMQYIYGDNYIAIEGRNLTSAFNRWADGRQFVVGNEVTIDDKRQSTSLVKNMITPTAIEINRKGIEEYTIPDCINYYFTSNHVDAFNLEESDRRLFVQQAREEPLPADYVEQYKRWLLQEDGAAHLFYYLQSELDLGDFVPTARPPMTASKVDSVTASRADIDDWVATLRADVDSLFPPTQEPTSYSLYTTEDILRVYDPDRQRHLTPVGMGRALANAGLRRIDNGSNNAVIDGVRRRLWCVRGDYANMRIAEAAALYRREREGARFTGGKANPDYKRRTQ